MADAKEKFLQEKLGKIIRQFDIGESKIQQLKEKLETFLIRTQLVKMITLEIKFLLYVMINKIKQKYIEF